MTPRTLPEKLSFTDGISVGISFGVSKMLAAALPFIILLAVSVFPVLLPIAVLAEDVKVATVDVHRILNDLTESKSKKAELDKLSQSAKSKVQDKQASLKKLEDSIKSRKLGEDSPEFEKYRQQARDLERFIRDTDEDLKRRFLKVNKDLTDRALAAIEQFARDHKLDLVLDKSEAVRGPVLFGNATSDITEEILKKLNG